MVVGVRGALVASQPVARQEPKLELARIQLQPTEEQIVACLTEEILPKRAVQDLVVAVARNVKMELLIRLLVALMKMDV
jgi:hypothetical protein